MSMRRLVNLITAESANGLRQKFTSPNPPEATHMKIFRACVLLFATLACAQLSQAQPGGAPQKESKT